MTNEHAVLFLFLLGEYYPFPQISSPDILRFEAISSFRCNSSEMTNTNARTTNRFDPTTCQHFNLGRSMHGHLWLSLSLPSFLDSTIYYLYFYFLLPAAI